MEYQHPFHIVIDGKACLGRELGDLCRHFDLLTEDRAKSFRQYLASPFFGHSSRLSVLFPILYQKSKGTASFLQGKALVRKLFAGGNCPDPERAIAQLIRQMIQAILNFLAVLRVQSCPAQRDRLLVDQLDGCTHPEIYVKAVESWRSSIAELPLGSERTVQSWRAEHAAHFSLSVRKDRQVQSEPAQAMQRLRDVYDLYTAQYGIERINRDRIFGSTEAAVHNAPIHDEHRQLIELYRLVEPLVAGPEDGDYATYQSFREGFMALHPRLSRHHSLVFYLLINNYLCRKNLIAPHGLDKEWSFWVNFMLDHRLYEEYPAITRKFFNNQLQIAFIIGEIGLAEKLIELLKHKLTFHQRQTTLLLANTMLMFYQDKHRAVIKLLGKLGTDERVHEHLDDEGLRFISLRVRSALCLYINLNEYMDEFARAMNNFHSLLNSRTTRVNEEKIQYFKRFANIAQRIYTLKNQHRLTLEYDKIMGLIETDQPLHAREWLQSLMLHFRPGLNLRGREVRPTLNRKEPWLNPR
ncbi:hypothetical protein GGR28_003635 [Lewinella aquimaris]|uniref:Uncharacterized protein n=1 Tax=Neolewinella aquimaris TaxID=1835722 RepID=A0A840E5S0_9BACT|nr:hypothetical protein [Neolewinella aquimaris]MBB4080994.1 hypothetical protein [Neolewinella aquimaris]